MCEEDKVMISIMKKEILEHLTTYRFALVSGLTGVLMAVSLLVGVGDYRVRLENYGVMQPKEPGSPNIVLPPNPVSVLVQGLDPRLGKVYELTSLGVTVHSNERTINRLFSLFAVPDQMFIIKVVLALTALLMSFDALCGEKEQGTLKLLLASGGRRSDIYAGKFLGRYLLTVSPFVIASLACVAVLSLLPDIQAGGYFLGRCALVLLVALVYAAVFTALGLLISSVAHRSETSLALSMSAWVLLVFVIPEAGPGIAQAARSVPASDRVEMETRQHFIQAVFERIEREKITGNGTDGMRMVDEIREANSQLMESYRPKLNDQITLADVLMRWSPAGAVTFLLADVTNTGIAEELRLKDAVVLHMNRNFNRFAGIDKTPFEGFSYERAGLGEIMSRTGTVNVIVLAAFFLGFLVFGMGMFSRYDPR